MDFQLPLQLHAILHILGLLSAKDNFLRDSFIILIIFLRGKLFIVHAMVYGFAFLVLFLTYFLKSRMPGSIAW